MSNRRRPARRTVLDTIAASIGDQRIPGGCDDCDAFQTLTKQSDSIFSVTVHHDATCPWLASRESDHEGNPR